MKFKDFRDADLAAFPTIDDFVIDLEPSEEGGMHLVYTSASRGRLAGFPAWDHADRDLRHFTTPDVPFGSVSDPYDDRDDAWRILIFEHDRFVYVLEGDAPNDFETSRFFRIPRDRYFAAWAAVIDRFNPLTPLDDESPDTESKPESLPS